MPIVFPAPPNTSRPTSADGGFGERYGGGEQREGNASRGQVLEGPPVLDQENGATIASKVRFGTSRLTAP